MSSDTFKLKLKLTAPLVQRHDEGKSHQGGNDSERIRIAPMDADENKSLLIGARGGAALKGLLSTAPNPEEAIRAFQSAHGLSFKTTAEQHGATQANGSSERVQRFTPAEQLLDLLHVSRSGMYQSLLSKLMDEMLLRIQELAQEELQRLLEATFPYIEFRELRKIPIAILSRQEDTPEAYLRELTENRRILSELPVHVRRKIMHVDKLELQYFVEQCTQEYIEEKLDWYLKHGGGVAATSSISSRPSGNGSASSVSDNGNDLWNVSSHMPSPSTRNHTQNAPEERRRQSAALSALSEMIGDSESLYLTTIEILKEYVVTANIPGSTNTNAKDYVDYVPLLGALRCDLANLQRDKTTPLLRTDPLHKFIWFLDRAVKNQNTLDLSQLHELLMVIKRLRTGDVPLNKKFKKKSEIQEEEDNFEIVLGPPPVDQLLIVLDKIAKVDARMIFAEPVPDDVPNYRDIIKEPMDLSTMRKKAKKGKYKTLEMFTEDFNLMIKNCMTFNPDTTVFYKEGKRVGKRGLEIIEKNAITLRGEPQRIRAKKRKKSGPAEAMTMLTSSGVTTLKDFGDVDQTGMVPEGICEETLADIAMILCDPHVKQMLCDALLKTLVSCLQKRELPTDNLVCRGLVQLLQIGNPASVRRMLRKRDFVLRAPQVVTMRVMLPLLIRAMSTYRIGLGTHPMQASREPKSLKQDLSDSVLWENMLRASSAIRSLTKAFVLQCFKDHHVELAAYLLELLTLVEDDLLFRDRIFLHSLGEIVLNDAKSHTSSLSSNDSDFGQSSNGNSGSLESITHSLIWKTVVDRFLVHSVETRTIAAKQSVGSAVQYYDPEEGDEVESFTDNGDTAKHLVVKSYPLPILHEKAIMVIATALNNASKANSGACDSITNMYLRKMLGTTRLSCSSRNDFEALWNSQSFQQCRLYYEPLLSRCPQLRDDIFSDHFESLGEVKTDEKAESKADAVNDEAADGGAAESHEDDPEREAGEVEEDAMMKDEP